MMRKVIGCGMVILGGISIACGIKWYSDSMKAIHNLEDALKSVCGQTIKNAPIVSVDSLRNDTWLEDKIRNAPTMSMEELERYDFEKISTPWTEPLA